MVADLLAYYLRKVLGRLGHATEAMDEDHHVR